MNVLRIAAFSHNQQGGNPAGVVICQTLPEASVMLQTAKEVGYSETAFLEPRKQGWRIRYFAPDMEIPFCGHATIASGAALGAQFGAGQYRLFLNSGEITVVISTAATGALNVTLQSPETWSKKAPQNCVDAVLACFKLSSNDLDPLYPIHFAFAGAKHLIVALNTRETLANMAYDFDELKKVMLNDELITINLIFIESNITIHARNPFPPGGVYEDPATGAAAAALAGYLRDIQWQGDRYFEVLQGQDMGIPSRLMVRYTNEIGESIQVIGETRMMSRVD